MDARNQILNALRWPGPWWLLTLPLIVLVYLPGLPGDFLFDDNPHIVRNALVQIYS